uniref:Uncharacterized protein n=1 Tax=Megaselia scalaris TaxID=36166 RepID=T1GFB2_MEGSC
MIGQGAMNYENEKAININSYFQVQNSQSSQNSLNFDADFVEQYLQENDISSQEIINGIPILESTETGLSQYLDNLDVKTEELVPDADIKPKAILTYSMVPKWDDVA